MTWMFWSHLLLELVQFRHKFDSNTWFDISDHMFFGNKRISGETLWKIQINGGTIDQARYNFLYLSYFVFCVIFGRML